MFELFDFPVEFYVESVFTNCLRLWQVFASHFRNPIIFWWQSSDKAHNLTWKNFYWRIHILLKMARHHIELLLLQIMNNKYQHKLIQKYFYINFFSHAQIFVKTDRTKKSYIQDARHICDFKWRHRFSNS